MILPEFDLFSALIFWFLVVISVSRQRFKIYSCSFFLNHLKRLSSKFQTNMLTLAWKKQGKHYFLWGPKTLKNGKNGQNRSNFFRIKLCNQYDLVNCTSEGQHTKFEVIWSIGWEIIAIKTQFEVFVGAKMALFRVRLTQYLKNGLEFWHEIKNQLIQSKILYKIGLG